MSQWDCWCLERNIPALKPMGVRVMCSVCLACSVWWALVLLYQGPGVWVLEYLPWSGSIYIFFEATLFAWVLLVCTSESANVNFRAHSPLEQIQIIAFSFWGRNDFTPNACPEPDLTAALSRVLKLLLSDADFSIYSALEPCPWSWALFSLARPWLTLGDFSLGPRRWQRSCTH